MILDKIAQATRVRVEKEKKEYPLEQMKEQALRMDKGTFPFEEKLKSKDVTFICEVKKASPSKGVIAEKFPYVDIAKEYENAGADCISVLTEPDFFLGSSQYLKEIREVVKLPLLKKDFTVDAYQIYEAKVIGADVVLLICSLLNAETLKEYIQICDRLGLSALVEAHDEEEIQLAVEAGARIIGVNNRNLKTFEVDIENCLRLRTLVPENVMFIAESGIKTREDIEHISQGNVNGVLIGETFMRSENKKETLEILKGM